MERLQMVDLLDWKGEHLFGLFITQTQPFPFLEFSRRNRKHVSRSIESISLIIIDILFLFGAFWPKHSNIDHFHSCFGLDFAQTQI